MSAQYNQSYNFFAGMSDDAVARYQKDALTGHLPTWKMGMVGGAGEVKGGASRRFTPGGADDPFGLFRDFSGPDHAKADAERRTARNAERKALHALGLEESATPHRHQGALQGAGEAPPPGRQWRRPRLPRTSCVKSSRPITI